MQRLLASLPPETRNVVEAAMKGQISSGAPKVHRNARAAHLCRHSLVSSGILTTYLMVGVRPCISNHRQG